ncbi:hypothetical protein [Methylomicrobium lacus]|uniref:hypothetical protein n=1 Tax=Methylomicrobium lacus TaxID=136992 RepID=UPI0035A89D11
MSKTNNFKKLTLCTLVAMACGGGQMANAHTGVKDSVNEGKSIYTAFTITHGCQDTPEANQEAQLALLPVKAQSVVFPNGTGSQAFKIDPVTKAETPIDLADYISGADGGVVTLAPGMVQDKNVFKKQTEVPVGDANVRGIQFTSGNLDTTAVGLIPFRATAPSFTATIPDGAGTAPNCAKSLKIRIGIANYCKKTQNEKQDNRADIWIGHLTTKFNDPGVMPHDWETSPFWPTLTVNRTSALDPSCGAGFDIAVQPSDSEIDTYLPIKGYWPK